MVAIKRPDPAKVLKEVSGHLSEQATSIVPWFIEKMPEYYFLTHSHDEQVRHLNAIISGQVLSEGQTLALGSPCRTSVTYISPGEPEALSSLLERHVRSNIVNARLYASLDGQLRLDTFIMAPQELPTKKDAAFRKACASMREHKHTPPLWPQDWSDDQEHSFKDFLAGATKDYVDKFEAERAARHFRLARMVEGTEDTAIDLENPSGTGESRISIAVSDPPAYGLLLQMAKVLQREGIVVHRGYADVFVRSPDGAHQSFAIISFYVCHEGKPLDPNSPLWKRLQQQLRLTPWVFARHGLQVLSDEHGWPLERVMLLQAGAEFAHQFLIKKNLWAYSADNINHALLAHHEDAAAVIEYFETRFAPNGHERFGRRSNEEALQACSRIEETLNSRLEHIEHEVARGALKCILQFFKHTLRTNYFLPTPHGLCFRLAPSFLDSMPEEEGDAGENRERPYGVFFYHGPYAQGFHVRYREMARGGLRVVRTRTQEQFELESNRLFDEVTKLAWAQQIKNKDIPEGGSKGVLLLGPEGDVDRSVKGLVDAMLDLVLTDDDRPAHKNVRDYLGKEEILFLGPDENITPDHVEWIVARAARRGYQWPAALMSSKPRAGINHKEYGVTSLGLIVFATEVLKHLGIDPTKEPFRVTFTGGPRGDVAGNAVKLLIDQFGDNARILTMADGHGAACDPEGLDHDELLRLIDNDLSISEFASLKLRGEGAFVITTDTPEKARIRNTLHNRVAADVFLPSGGRPDTINARNWEEFLDEEGRPIARSIVEGANIFISPEARDRLQEAGALIVNGSSANKTGVICSSYEILAGLVSSEKEFLAMKKTYVREVLDILRKRAGDEARLMLRERRERLARGRQAHLTKITLQLSMEMNNVADALIEALCDAPQKGASIVARDQQLKEFFLAYCPPVLVRKFEKRLLEDVPERHQIAVVAAHLASHIVYSEGLGWLERMTRDRDAISVMRAYLEQEKHIEKLLDQLKHSRLSEREELARIVANTGRKFLTSEALERKRKS